MHLKKVALSHTIEEYAIRRRCLLPMRLTGSVRHKTLAAMPARSDRCIEPTHDDVALIERVADKDGAAFETLYRGYYRRLHRFLERVTKRPQIVEEVLNDTMLAVWRKAPTYNHRSKVSTWIFGIAVRRALKTLKRVESPLSVELDERIDFDVSIPDGALAALEIRARLAQALEALSPDHRAVIELTCVGYSCAQIATALGCPINTVKSRMFHARRRLRALMSAEPETADKTADRPLRKLRASST
jgi:RNA polymerase sigma-70 factor (ECF subfamily)